MNNYMRIQDLYTNKSNSGPFYLKSHVCSGRLYPLLPDFTWQAVNEHCGNMSIGLYDILDEQQTVYAVIQYRQ